MVCLPSLPAGQKQADGMTRLSEMGSWLAADPSLAADLDSADLQTKLKAKNEEELAKLEEKVKDAQANHGETELSDALRAKATYLAKIGEKVCMTAVW